MKRFLKSVAGKILLGVLLLILAAAGTLGGIVAGNTKFQDVTVELGSEFPPIEDFLTKFAIDSFVNLETDLASLDLTRTGERELTFRHGLQTEQVTLHIVDTTAPTATFQDVSSQVGTELKPEDFVVEMDDLSPLSVSFAQPLTVPESYGDVFAEVIVSDDSGNQISKSCRIRYAWMVETFALEYGSEVTKSDLLLNPEKDDHLLDQETLDTINQSGIGEYTVTSSDGDLSYDCVITVQDTTGPHLELKDVTVYVGGRVNLRNFLVSAEDLSGDVETRLLTELTTKTVGELPVEVEAKDIYGNITVATATLKVIRDTAGPTFTGVDNLTVEKNTQPDLQNGVAAYDTKDGYVSFTVDDSKLDTTQYGTYYVVYSAEDAAGNQTTYRRKVTVNHDSADRYALVQEIAGSIQNGSPLYVRNWCHDNISYHANINGGGDSVWHGLRNRTGNCYVQATCLKALLDAKGYETQLIWVTDYSHYWVLVKTSEGWRHLDSTPGSRHNSILLVTDDYREAHLQGRTWDKTKWPAAE